MSNQNLNVLFPDVTEIDIDVTDAGAVEFELLQQFGFAVEVQEIAKDFYKIDMNTDQSGNQVYSGNAVTTASSFYTALKETKMKYLVDSPSDQTIDVSGWTESGLTDNGNMTVAHDTFDNVGQQILHGIVSPLFTGEWSKNGVEGANQRAIALDSDHSEAHNSASTATHLDHKLAQGLYETINGASDEAHDEIIQHLLTQVIDGNSDVQNKLEAARKIGLVDPSSNSASGVDAYAGQDFWMKVYLDMNLGGVPSVTDYEQDISGSTFDPNEALRDDDDEGAASDDNQANLVRKTAGTAAVLFEDLNSDFLTAAKGEVRTSSGDVKVYRGNDTEENVGVAIGSSTQISLVRVPILFKFHVAA